MNCACVLARETFFTMHVGKRKRVGLYACNCAKCKTTKMKCFYSYLTARRHRNSYGTSTAEVNEMDREGCVRRMKEVHGNSRITFSGVFQSCQCG